MKKILLTLAASALMSSSVLADNCTDSFFGTISVGGNYFQKAKDKYSGLKMKSEYSTVLGFEVGYGYMDCARAGLEYKHHFDPVLSKSGTYGNISGKAKHKIHLDTLMVKGVFDLFEYEPMTMFAGLGLGGAKVHENISFSGNNFAAKSRTKNNFAYSVLAGVSFNVADNAYLDIKYNYTDAGTTKSNTSSTANREVAKTRLQIHTADIGIRFAF